MAGDRKVFVVGEVSVGFASILKATDMFLCFAWKLQIVDDIRSMLFGCLLQFLLLHDEQFTLLLSQAYRLQFPELHVQLGLFCGSRCVMGKFHC